MNQALPFFESASRANELHLPPLYSIPPLPRLAFPVCSLQSSTAIGGFSSASRLQTRLRLSPAVEEGNALPIRLFLISFSCAIRNTIYRERPCCQSSLLSPSTPSFCKRPPSELGPQQPRSRQASLPVATIVDRMTSCLLGLDDRTSIQASLQETSKATKPHNATWTLYTSEHAG